MRWGDMRRSENVEDRTAGGGGGGFGIGGLPLSGGALILVVIASLLFGVNPLELLGGGPDDDVDTVAEHVQLGVGDQCRNLDQRVRRQVQTRHLAVDPDDPILRPLGPRSHDRPLYAPVGARPDAAIGPGLTSLE